MVATTTAAALALLAFARTRWLRAGGLVVIVALLVLGLGIAHETDAGALPDARWFIVATTLVNAIGWCVLGAMTGAMLRRLRN
jgi:predicted cobalt transporter CbtA